MTSDAYLSHFERYLGSLDSQFSKGDDTDHLQLLRFRAPAEQIITFATFGLNRYPLKQPSGREVRQELILSCDAQFADLPLAGVLGTVAEQIIHKGTALARGELLGPAGPIAPGLEMTALYATHPVHLPDEFAEYPDPPTTMVWLVPVTNDEAAYQIHHGWSAFEDRLEEHEPDLLDLRRPSLALPHP